MSELLLYFFAAAVVQNLVLATGFGTSMILRIIRHPRDIVWFGGSMTYFSLLTALSGYLLDWLISTETLTGLDEILHFLRPLLLIVVVSLWYLLTVLVFKNAFSKIYHRMELWLPMSAFNNVVVGVALIANHQFSVSLLGAVGMSIGASVGFTLLSLLVAEAREQLDHTDLPHAFRGLPVLLLWLGLIALAVMGFSSSVSFI